MPRTCLSILMCVASCANLGFHLRAVKAEEPALLSRDLLDEGWISLFDGQSLYGWKATSEANWQVEDGAIVVSQGQPGLLRTTCQFSDFELSLEFKADPATNSGVFVRTPPVPRDPTRDCFEINIAPADNPFPTASLVGRLRGKRGATTGKWQSLVISAAGERIMVRLDGEEVTSHVDPNPLGRGYIGLQLNRGRVAFRHLRLRPLGTRPLFDGKSLAGWTTYPEMKSQFSVTADGELHVRDGRGQLETEQSYGDFVLQLQCRTNADHLNSGIFFRCIPGDVMMGYESQIHNGYQSDRGQPVDCGTGGIFRRVDARRIVADDQSWFHKTLVVEGPHMAVWVNGFQVSDWTDQRKPHENPRQGLRMKPGTIMIQGHDPTTDILFRDLRIVELKPRRSSL